MRKVIVAFCDMDEVYRRRFVAYLMEHKAKEMTVCAFSEPTILLEQEEKQEFDVIILGDSFSSIEKEIEQTGIPIIKLTEQIPEYVAEEIDYFTEEKRKKVSVFKYQPMEKILHEVQAIVGGNRMIRGTGLLYEQEVIGVCSPVNHEMQMAFSIIFATLLSEKRKVLYLNFMQFSGMLKNYNMSGEYDLGDVIMRLRKKRMNTEDFFRSIYETDGFSYMLPFRNPEQIGEFSLDDFQALLTFVKEETNFEVLVIDFSVGMQSFAEMLAQCSSCYSLEKNGYYYEPQTEEFLEYLQKVGKESVLERLHRVNLPFSAKGLRGGGNVLEQLLWSEFGDYMRDYLSGELYGGE